LTFTGLRGIVFQKEVGTTLLWNIYILYYFTFSWEVEVSVTKCDFCLQPPENKRITSLKRYLRLAGIHTVQYSKVLQNCHSNKAKIEALLNLLRKEGLKGAYSNITNEVTSLLKRFYVSSLWFPHQ
jgi:hypothetical protein